MEQRTLSGRMQLKHRIGTYLTPGVRGVEQHLDVVQIDGVGVQYAGEDLLPGESHPPFQAQRNVTLGGVCRPTDASKPASQSFGSPRQGWTSARATGTGDRRYHPLPPHRRPTGPEIHFV